MSLGKELQRACLCLNICFTIVPEDVLSTAELELARSLFNPESIPKVLLVGRLSSMNVKFPTLTSRVEQQGWTLHTCDCCMASVLVVDENQRAAVDGACKRESEFESVTSSANFSTTFGIAIPNKSAGAAAWHSIDDVSGCPQELLALATEKISNEKLAVDQRIKMYNYQQREQFEAFRQRTLVELEALSAAAVKDTEEKPTTTAPFIRASSPKSRTSPFSLTPPRSSPTPPIITTHISSSGRSGSLLERRPSINSSYPSRDSVSLDSPGAGDTEPQTGDDSIFEFEEDVTVGSTKGYYLSANPFTEWSPHDEEDGPPSPEARAPLAKSEGFAIASSLPISIPQPFKFTPYGNSVSRGNNNEFKSGSVQRGVGLSTSALSRLHPRQQELDEEDQGVVNMLLPPHSSSTTGGGGGDSLLRTRKGSEKDAEEQFEHAVRFQSLSLKTRTYL